MAFRCGGASFERSITPPVSAAVVIHTAYPHLSIGTALTEAILNQARTKPEKAPLLSATAQLLRERSSPSRITTIEQLAQTGRWGE
jgi:hypothetical protein